MGRRWRGVGRGGVGRLISLVATRAKGPPSRPAHTRPSRSTCISGIPCVHSDTRTLPPCHQPCRPPWARRVSWWRGSGSGHRECSTAASPLLFTAPRPPRPALSPSSTTHIYAPGPAMRPSSRSASQSRPSARPAARPQAPRAEPANNSAAGFDPRLSSDEIELWQAPGKSATPLLVSVVFDRCVRVCVECAWRAPAALGLWPGGDAGADFFFASFFPCPIHPSGHRQLPRPHEELQHAAAEAADQGTSQRGRKRGV